MDIQVHDRRTYLQLVQGQSYTGCRITICVFTSASFSLRKRGYVKLKKTAHVRSGCLHQGRLLCASGRGTLASQLAGPHNLCPGLELIKKLMMEPERKGKDTYIGRGSSPLKKKEKKKKL
eukprot:scaffold112612_cov14-Tisochrysis_lutea.AAC.1